MDEESVSLLLERLKSGDRAAAMPLWNRYFERLVHHARGRLAARVRRVADEEDVALSAFHSFCRAAEAGRFPRLDDRDDLWTVLVMITERKACDIANRATAAKRGGGKVRGDSILRGETDEQAIEPPSSEPTPEFAAEVAEECERLLARLGENDPLLRDIALWKLEGFTNAEIAEKSGKSLPTVERKLALIRSLWDAEGTT